METVPINAHQKREDMVITILVSVPDSQRSAILRRAKEIFFAVDTEGYYQGTDGVRRPLTEEERQEIWRTIENDAPASVSSVIASSCCEALREFGIEIEDHYGRIALA